MSRARMLLDGEEPTPLADTGLARADLGVGVEVGLLVAGRYRLLRLLGRGGMGVVYEAVQVGLDRRVALKLLRPELVGQKEYDGRFIRETRCLGAVSSEHVVRLLDAGRLDTGQPFLVMDRLEGMNLAALLAACGPLSARTAVSYAQQLCAGLAAVHASGIMHLDIKPANLFLVSRGNCRSRLRILDFGIARWLHSRATRTPRSSTSLLGSPRYSSPEQLDDHDGLDERSDVWSLGVVLFEMLTGTTPFPGTCFTSICAQVLLVPTPSALEARATLDHRLVAVVETCLQKKPEHRFSSVRALAEALHPFSLAASSDFAASSTRDPLHAAGSHLGRLSTGRALDVAGCRPRPGSTHHAH